MNWLIVAAVLSLIGAACCQRGLDQERTSAADLSKLSQFTSSCPSGPDSIWIVTVDGDLRQISKNGEAKRANINAGEIVVVNFLDSMHGWVIDRKNRTWRTSDGGNSWQLATTSSKETPNFYLPQQLIFVDEVNGWLIGIFKIWRTLNGGETWQEQFSVSDTSEERVGRLYRGAFVGPESGWVTSSSGILLQTNDGGKTWKTLTVASEHTDLHEIVVSDGHSGWLVGRPQGGIFLTKDGGMSWHIQLTDADRTYINSLSFVDEQDGWAAGWRYVNPDANRNGILMHTSDGGQTWLQKETDVAEPFFERVTFDDKKHGWLLARDDVYYTEDSGNSWRRVFRLPPMRNPQ